MCWLSRISASLTFGCPPIGLVTCRSLCALSDVSHSDRHAPMIILRRMRTDAERFGIAYVTLSPPACPGATPYRAWAGGLLLRRQNLLNAYLIDEMLSPYIDQMRCFLLICQTCADPLGHRHNKRAISISSQYDRRTSLLDASCANGLSGSTLRSGSKKRGTDAHSSGWVARALIFAGGPYSAKREPPTELLNAFDSLRHCRS